MRARSTIGYRETCGGASARIRCPAAYVHRLAVAQTHRGSRLGQRLLAWVEQRAADSGAAFVRLDCATNNPGLRRFYEQQGFRHLRDVSVTALEGGRQLASSLYERELVR